MKDKKRICDDRMTAFEEALSDSDERSGWVNDENVFENPDDGDILNYVPNPQKLMTVTLTRRKWVNRVLEYAEKYPKEVKVIHKNKDGSIVAHIPVSYLKITRPREYTEEQKSEMVQRLLRDRADK